MLILAEDSPLFGAIVVVATLAIVAPFVFVIYKKLKVVADKAVRDKLAELGLEHISIESSWFPPAKLVLEHRKGNLWYTIELKRGGKKHARVHMFLTKVVSLEMYD